MTRRRWLLCSGIFLLGIAAAVLLVWGLTKQGDTIEVSMGDGTYQARVARTLDERTQGLSGTASLDYPSALLFVFEQSDTWGIWMKDMNYAIDIIWIDEGQRIVHIVEEATPRSYPDTTFAPSEPARYVIEVPAGSVARDTIEIGQRVSMEVGEL